MMLARAAQPRYDSRCLTTTGNGFSSPCGAAISRTAFAMRLFCRLGVPFNGRPGRGSRKARRCSTGLLTPFGAVHPFSSGLAVHNRNWSNTMTTTANGAAAPKTTARHDFTRANSAGKLLFAVNEGVPLLDALEMAGAYMSAAVSVTEDAATLASSNADETLWGAHYLCKLAAAVLSSAVEAAYALERESNHV